MLDISFNFINRIKKNFFPFYKNKELKFVFNRLQEGVSHDTVTARFVGGCVRKYLSNDEIDDIFDLNYHLKNIDQIFQRVLE